MRLVVKVGTQVVSRPDGTVALGPLGSLVEQVHAARVAGHQVVLVSSGAVGLGAGRLGMGRPVDLVDRQAAAAVGQGLLMGLYDALFSRLGSTVAQVLVTEGDFHHRDHYLNLGATFERLLTLQTIPVVNQNDVVSTKELEVTGSVFGDNDRLAALVASNLGADRLLLLSDIDGLYTAPPGSPGATRIPLFEADAAFEIGAGSLLGTGGMGGKVEAARVAARSGVRVVIDHGHQPGVVAHALTDSTARGTTFLPEPNLNRRRRWIAFAAGVTGRLVINAGAAEALSRDASLLYPGIVAVEGNFTAGGVVEVVHGGRVLARGRTRASAAELREGLPTGRGVVLHRDDLVKEGP